ncbi:hypothetical protein JCM3770_002575 [Rhodotorula araucariae]
MHAVADFCAVPMGVETGVSKYIAEIQRVLAASGLKYELHGYGTGLEGEFSDVMKVIEQCHDALHKMGCPRIATDIRIGTRTDKQGSLAAKVASVKALLANDDPAQAAGGNRANAPGSIDLPASATDPEAELARRVSETKQFLLSPNYDPPAGRDA